MEKRFGKSILGYNPEEVGNAIKYMEDQHRERINVLQDEIEAAKSELKESEEKILELQKRLHDYIEREHMIAEVLMNAHKNAQRMEEEAREKARIMMEKSEEELKIKLQELEMLRSKAERFRAEFREILDDYRISLETMKLPSNETVFTPTLVVKENNRKSI